MKVVCIDSTGCPELVEGKSYPVTDSRECPCGAIGLGVGILERQLYVTLKCPKCNRVTNNPSKYILFRSERFIDQSVDFELDEAIHESLKGVKIES